MASNGYNVDIYSNPVIILYPSSTSPSPTATSIMVSNVSGTPNTNVTLTATILESGTPLVGAVVTFSVNGVTVGNGISNSSGIATYDYIIPSDATIGNEEIDAFYVGVAGLTENSSGIGTLTVTTPPIPAANGLFYFADMDENPLAQVQLGSVYPQNIGISKKLQLISGEGVTLSNISITPTALSNSFIPTAYQAQCAKSSQYIQSF